MISRSRLALAAALLIGGAAVLTAAAGSNGWVRKLGGAWSRTQDEIHIFCDGPHRVYVILSADRNTAPALNVLANGCTSWPKYPAEAQ